MVVVGKGFRRGDQGRAQHGGLGALGQHARHVTAIGQAAGGGHGHARVGQQLGQQLHQRLAPAHMAAGLHALGDEGLGAGVLRVDCVLQRADLVHHGDAGGAQACDEGPVYVPEQADHGHAERNA